MNACVLRTLRACCTLLHSKEVKPFLKLAGVSLVVTGTHNPAHTVPSSSWL